MVSGLRRWSRSPTTSNSRAPERLELLGAEAQHVFQSVIAFVTCVFENPIPLVPVQRKRHFPGTGVHVRIVDGGFVLNRVFVNAREAFDRVSGLAQRNASNAARGGIGRDPALSIEAGGVDNQRVTVPMAARISIPRPEVGPEMRAAVEWDDASLMDHFRVQDDVTRRLHNLVAVVVGARPHRSRYAAGDTSLPRPVVFGEARVNRKSCVALFNRFMLQRNSPVRWVHNHRRPSPADGAV